MADLKYADRVAETAVTYGATGGAGMGDIFLSGAISTEHSTFAAKFADGDLIPISVFGGGKWLEIEGTFNLGANSIMRTTFRDSSTGVDLALSGTMTVLCGWGSADARAMIRNDRAQSLNSTQKNRALANVGAVGTDALQPLTSTQQGQARANIGVIGRNRIINGQFAINQRSAAGGVTDNAYSADRWRMIGEFSNANIFPDNYNAAGGNVPSAAFQFPGTTDKGGFFQVIEGRNCKDLRGKTVTLSMLMSVSNARLGNMKIGILEWTGTEDATTGDPVSSWGADGVTPTLATNWAFKNTPANLGVTTSSALYSATVAIGSTFTNLAVMIWNDDKSYTTGDFFNVTNVQLEEGGVATSYDQRPYGQELFLSQRYFSLLPGWIGKWITTTTCQIAGSFWTKMRATPAVSVVYGTAAMNDYGVGNPNLVSFSAAAIGDSGGYLNFNTSAATNGGLCAYLNNIGKVFLDAEI